MTAATATGATGRIDDETRGLALKPSAAGTRAGSLLRARSCYVCKQRYVEVDAFYHQLCPACAARNHERRTARTDLTGRRALLTGGRANIGMYIALRLLRDGAHTTITTRFPNDAVRRFTTMDDSPEWLDRLRIVGIDMRDPGQVIALTDDVTAQGPLDILINNAAQTVRRSPEAYAHIAATANAPLPDGPLPELVVLGADRGGSCYRRAWRRALGTDAASAPRARADVRLGVGGTGRCRCRDRRGGPRPRPASAQQLEPGGERGRSRRAARGPALQPDRAVHPHQPAAPGSGSVARSPDLRGQRVRDGGPIRSGLQGARPPAQPTWPRPR